MKMKNILLTSLITLATNSNAMAANIEDSIQKFNWNGVEVVYIEDARFPTFDLSIYFADGSLSEKEGHRGMTTYSFDLIDSGTKKLTQKEVLEKLEFIGINYGADVTSEYTRFSVSGLTKDLNESMSLVCSLLRDTTYPEAGIKNDLEISKNGIENMVSNLRGISERVFREVSLKDTVYAYPTSGKLADFPSYTPSNLRNKMDYFLNDVKKRVYITGPKDVLKVQSILKNDCKFKGSEKDFVRVVENPGKASGKVNFVFVPVPDANQVQLKIGRFVEASELKSAVLNDIASEFLGGGFTSRLMREVRTKRGLTYTIGSFVSGQKQYGRAGISTFTKNETIDQLIEVIDNTVKSVKTGITDQDLSHATDGLIGGHPFKFETNTAFLSQLLYLDHIGRPYSDLFEYRDEVKKYNGKDVAKKITDIFSMDKQTILVLGDKSIEPKLKKLTKKYGKLTILDYKNYL